MDIENIFHKKAALIVLQKRLKIDQPSQAQVNEMANILSEVWLRRTALLNENLTEQERLCLLLASQGNTAEETAGLLNITEGTVRTHERAIVRKLGCKNMKQAIAVGIRYLDKLA